MSGKTQKSQWGRRRGKYYAGIIVTVLLAAATVCYGGTFIDKARTLIGGGRDAAREYVEENDPTGTVRRREHYLKEERKSFHFIKKYLGKSGIPENSEK